MKEKIPLKDRAADRMRLGMGTWSAFFGMLGFMACWMIVNGKHGFDPYPFVLLNLCLSTLAGLQGVILLIAAKRSDAQSEALVQHISTETDEIDVLIKENTELTKEIHRLLKELHNK